MPGECTHPIAGETRNEFRRDIATDKTWILFNMRGLWQISDAEQTAEHFNQVSGCIRTPLSCHISFGEPNPSPHCDAVKQLGMIDHKIVRTLRVEL